MYTVWLKVDDALPWIELNEDYPTKLKAEKAVKEILKITKAKVVKISTRATLLAPSLRQR